MAERVALATSAALAALPEDDRLVLEPLAMRGIVAEPVVWDDPAVRWTDYDAIVIRSCWDYHERPGEFLAWVDGLEAAGVPLFNPPSVVRWNADKAYLRALEAVGTPIVPTRWTDPGEPATLAALLEEAGWDEAVVKPVVSAGARNTWRTSRARAVDDEARFRSLARRERLMVQPFLREIAEEGEWSLVYFGGRFSHAVVKRPKPGDFRVQEEHGGHAVAAVPGSLLVAAAEGVHRNVPEPCLYARVDGCVVDGRFLLMELEVLEPALFLAAAPGAAERFAAALAEAMTIAGR